MKTTIICLLGLFLLSGVDLSCSPFITARQAVVKKVSQVYHKNVD